MQDYDIKKILVPLDGSQNSFRGLDRAIYVARQCRATITGLCVAYAPPKLVFDSIEGINPATRKKIDAFMEDAKTTAAKNGIDFEGKIILGSAERDILDYASKWNFDLIVIGSRGAGSSDEFYLGSIANHILHRSSIPVLVVK